MDLIRVHSTSACLLVCRAGAFYSTGDPTTTPTSPLLWYPAIQSTCKVGWRTGRGPAYFPGREFRLATFLRTFTRLAGNFVCVCLQPFECVCASVCVSVCVCVWGKNASVCVCTSQSSIKLFRLLFLATLSICLKRKLLWEATKTRAAKGGLLGGSVASPIQPPIHIQTRTRFYALWASPTPPIVSTSSSSQPGPNPQYLRPPPWAQTLLLFLTLLQLRIVFVGIFWSSFFTFLLHRLHFSRFLFKIPLRCSLPGCFVFWGNLWIHLQIVYRSI